MSRKESSYKVLLMMWGLVGGLGACRSGELLLRGRLVDPLGPEVTLTCLNENGQEPVAVPELVHWVDTTETGWYSSPAIVDLDGDGRNELVAAFRNVMVLSEQGQMLAGTNDMPGRIYAPSVVADIDGDGRNEVVVGSNKGMVMAYEWRDGELVPKPGWPASTCSAGVCPETRSVVAADLDRDGLREVVVATTNTQPGGAQIFVFNSRGKLFQPAGTRFPAWPRYNTRTGTGGDADWNGIGNRGAGCYGENLGVGNLDDDPQLEIAMGNDLHNLNVFNHDGTSLLASSHYTNRLSPNKGRRLGWGQFIRWRDPAVEERLYHDHGAYPDLNVTEWLQWTLSPPTLADLDGDGYNELVGIPTTERYDPYQVVGYAFLVLEGGQKGGVRSGLRPETFAQPFWSRRPVPDAFVDYPPVAIPAPTVIDIIDDARPEIIAPTGDGHVYAVSPDNRLLWDYNYAHGQPRTYASEVTVADLNRDGVPELVFGTYSGVLGGGRLIVINNMGQLLYDIPLRHQRANPNGVGVPAAPTIGDLDNDGQLEIALVTFDHGLDIYTVPGSGTGCRLWPTARGSYTRGGVGPATVRR
jgi:hypothetical protein